MKKLILIILLILSILSCSNDDDNCEVQRAEIIEKYERLIELAEGDEQQQQTLIRDRDVALRGLDC